MKILVAPLNWGLGHASRCVPLVQGFLDEGHEVILGGDGESLTLLRRHFPKLRYVYLAPLNLRYSRGSRQVFAMLRALPRLIAWSIKDHALLRAVLREEPFDRIVSDNRFGLFVKRPQTTYMTHQLHIMLPKGWQWLEPLAERLHARIYRRFDEVWVPDYEDPEKSLAGEMSHLKPSNLQILNI
jgi:UDP:flavonoid glycosyltransferase YjiC (YdhE family)